MTLKAAAIYCVLHVLLVSASVQVERVHASPVVAGMTDLMIFRKLSNEDFIGNVCYVVESASKLHVPVSSGRLTSCPFPAAMRNDFASVNDSAPGGAQPNLRSHWNKQPRALKAVSPDLRLSAWHVSWIPDRRRNGK